MADNFKSDYFNMPVHVSFNFLLSFLVGEKECSADPGFLRFLKRHHKIQTCK